MATVGIFPAAGALGGSVYEHLLSMLPAKQVILISRHPEKIPESYVNDGVRIRQASYESTSSELRDAFDGVSVLFLISYPSHVHEYRKKVCCTWSLRLYIL